MEVATEDSIQLPPGSLIRARAKQFQGALQDLLAHSMKGTFKVAQVEEGPSQGDTIKRAALYNLIQVQVVDNQA